MAEEKCPNCARLEARVAELEEIVRQLVARIQVLDERNRALEAEVLNLRARLNMNSNNSSKPPSSDGLKKPKTKIKNNREPSGKPPGGVPGHDGKTLEQAADPTFVVPLSPEVCPCGASLEHVPAIDEERRQVYDLPAIQFHVTEYVGAVKECPCCGRRVKAEFPDDVKARAQYGPVTRAMMMYLRHFQMLPLNRITLLFEHMTGRAVSEGAIEATDELLFEALAPFEEDVKEHLKRSDVLHLDETGMRVACALSWLHVTCTDRLVFLGAHKKRGKDALDAFGILADTLAKICHDCWSPYFKFDELFHILCNAHILRELIYAHEELGEEWAGKLRRLLLDAKKLVDQRAAEGSVLTGEEIERIVNEFFMIIATGRALHPAPLRDPRKRGRPKRSKGANLLERLASNAVSVLAFLRGLPFTNNMAEQALRMDKLRQKISGCFRTIAGFMKFARIRSYIQTALKNDVDIFEALACVFRGQPLTVDQMLAASP